MISSRVPEGHKGQQLMGFRFGYQKAFYTFQLLQHLQVFEPAHLCISASTCSFNVLMRKFPKNIAY